MAGIDVGSGTGKRRSLDTEINMIPMIDLMMVTVSFLLITAVWSSMGRVEASASVPSPRDESVKSPPPEPRLHVELRADKPALVSARLVDAVLESREVREDELGAAVGEIWRRRGAHLAPNDRARDTVVLHAEDTLAHARIVGAMDRIATVRRANEPALTVVFSSK